MHQPSVPVLLAAGALLALRALPVSASHSLTRHPVVRCTHKRSEGDMLEGKACDSNDCAQSCREPCAIANLSISDKKLALC